MKRFQYPNGVFFAAALALAGASALQGCGGSEGGTKDATGTDGPGGRLDAGYRDAPSGPEVVRRDGPVTPLDTAPDQAGPGEEVASPPDAPPETDVPMPPVEAGQDQLPPPPDVPMGEPGRLDGGEPDVPRLPDGPRGEAGIPDAPAIDGAGIDSAPIEAGSPGLLTGWPTAGLDFGANPCGGETPAAKTFTLTNAGGTTVTLTQAKFTGDAGYTTDGEGKTIASGGTLVVTVLAPAVPETANIPTSYNDVLAVKTDIPGDDQHLIPVTQTAQGAILVWDTSPEFGAFGELSPGHSTSASFHVINMGNVTAEVALATTGDFAVTSQTPVTIAPASASDSVVAFNASTGGARAGTLSMSLATPVALCQPLPDPLTLTGTSINGALALSAVSLDFASECGAEAPASKTLTVTNTGVLELTWTAALEKGAESPFQISPTTSTLTPVDGGAEVSAVITVTPTTPSTATPITDNLIITTNAVGDTPHKVLITQTALGDVVSVVGSGSIDLGSVPIVSPQLTSEPVTVTLRNGANLNSAPAVLTLQMTGDNAAYFAVTPTQLTIAAGTEEEVSVTFSPGTNPGIVTSGNHVDLSATLHWQIGTEANCGAASGDVTASGTATLGQVSGIPGQLDFGLVNCGETGLQKQFTIVNSGSATYQITDVALVNSTYYTAEYPTLPKTMTPSDSMVVTVTPGQLPATMTTLPDHEKYDGRLTITTDILGDVPHEVNLLMGARGAIITTPLTPLDWNFGDTSVGQTLNFYIPVENAGNVPVTAALKEILIDEDQAGVFSLDSPAILPANQISSIVALFQPNEANSTFNATAKLVLSVASDAAFCQPLPAGWNSTDRNVSMHGSSLASTPQ